MSEAQDIAAEINEAKTVWVYIEAAAEDGADDDETLEEYEAFTERWSV